MTATLFIGTYAHENGEGLAALIRDPYQPGWVTGVANAQVANASFGVAARRSGTFYFVDERAGQVSAWGTRPAWHPRGTIASGGEAPCHLALSRDERRLAIANYESGDVRLVALNDDGNFGEVLATYRRDGHGPNVDRQRGPHAHWVGFAGDDAWLFSTDLGADRILALPLSGDPAAATPQVAWESPPGSGPRHLLLHPRLPVAYCVTELASTLVTLDGADGRFTTRDTIPMLPDGHDGESFGGAIAMNADTTRLWTTNRGHDSIATFALDTNGRATLIGHTPSGGESPRHLLALNDELICPHEADGSVTIFALRDGVPQPHPQRITVPGAVFAILGNAA